MLNIIIDFILLLCFVNVCLVKLKMFDLLDFIYSFDVDLFVIMEIWFFDDDIVVKLEFILSEIYVFVNQNCFDCKGGGIGLFFKKNIEVKKIDVGEKILFEFFEWCVCYNLFKVRLFIIYCFLYFFVYLVIVNIFL